MRKTFEDIVTVMVVALAAWPLWLIPVIIICHEIHRLLEIRAAGL